MSAHFYTSIRQLALSLPGADEDLQRTLQNLPLHAVLVKGVNAQLETMHVFDERVDSEHLGAVIRESQQGGFWRVDNAESFTVPKVGPNQGQFPP